MPKSTKPPSTTTTRTTRTRTPRTSSATTIDLSLNHDDIAIRAYELYLGEGAIHGRDVDHWLKAENELRDRGAANGR